MISGSRDVSSKSRIVRDIYGRLSQAAGPRHWWPGDTRDEIIIGAVLTQNTSWRNVEKAIANLKSHRLCNLSRIAKLNPEDIAPLIRSSGYYNLKAKRLHAVATFFQDHPLSLKLPTAQLRAELLAIRGVGRETADSILLYALDHQIFVVDAYTIRVLSRHGLCDSTASYEEAREILESTAPDSIQDYNEFHALLVWVGHHYCKPTPKCAECPLFRRSCFSTEKAWKRMRNELQQVPSRAARVKKIGKKD